MNLAVRICGAEDSNALSAEIETTLCERLLPSGLWGHFWIDNKQLDPTPRLYPSAMTLLSFCVLRDASMPVGDRIAAVANQLEEKLSLAKGLSILETAAASAAILACKGKDIESATRRQLAGLAAAGRVGLDERVTYFYDYEYLPEQEGASQFGRDYFIVPTEILIAIAGFQPGAPSSLRLMAEASLDALSKNLQHHHGLYCPGENERVNTKDQAWAALLLKISTSGYQGPGRISRMKYWLFRKRDDNWFTGLVFPWLSMLVMTAFDVITKDAALPIQLLTAAGTLVVGALYGSEYIRKLFPGRK
jgi:hypothetical protein